ncbi:MULTISPECIES: lysis protein [Klebsiella pneumoniae complex]|uniref:lysis protein n=1 Tax=Klebsiella pneumoniae complex TaxID=3390273 RepID=UPI001036CD70|nr:lysis protein [Klebsiella quasipneumoniae]MCP6094902.1 lysis protein [Klebsiella pneumoniae]TBP46758.1 lysis protein [Klebsiella quasipneumoniae subsp. quasipneumoniae]TBP76777.1 lysis protein [Klebsiella quasipneumoniae subsp. quasipneumoniae]TBQ02577.1 lysis protein [Klebsiella quasipneumoniae subsp. quasipneumoniae]TBQ69804.1 lysis protein [Klebsiella quasipneumoniae subsp. quasipneumoniae]
MSRLTAIISAIVICLIVSLGWLASHYHSNATEFKRQRDEKVKALNLAYETITDMTTRQRDVAALDAKYTGEQANAKATIDQLERDVASGKRRLQLNAKCPSNGTAATGGLGDASGPRLTDSAERDYFTLRERIVTITGQVNYLQDYIRTQCLR